MANTYIYNMSDLWSNVSNQFTAIGMNVTDSGSLPTSHLIKLQIGGANKFAVDKTGNIVSASLYANQTVSAPTIVSNGTMTVGNTTANVSLSYDAANLSVMQIFANVNAFIQTAMTNANTGNNASADIVVYDNNGIVGANYVNMGINNSNWDQPWWTINGQNDAYVYSNATNLAVGTGGTANLVLFAGGTLAVNEKIRITSSNLFIIANSTALVANGSNGASGSVLASNGTGLYWTVGTATVGSFTANSTTVSLGNATINTVATQSTLTFSNSTSRAVVNTSTLALGNTAANSVLTTTSLAVQNSTSSVQIVNPANVFISNNTGLNLGTATKAANGSTYLPNGLLMNWGWVSATSTTGTVTFTTAYPTNAYSISATSNTATSTYQAAVISWTNTGASIRTGNTTATNVFWMAIGS